MNSAKQSTTIGTMEIAPGYTVRDWTALDLANNDPYQWRRAIKIFDTRLRCRFVEPADVLIAQEIGHVRGTFGFAILAIDCLLVETLQRFREGRIEKGENGRLIRTFLCDRLRAYFGTDAGKGSLSDKFYERCRCGIHHSGQTDGDFRVLRSGPLIQVKENDVVTVNRTIFHEALKKEFDAYLAELSDGKEGALRRNFKRNMDAICSVYS